jgi:hypothetical protein
MKIITNSLLVVFLTILSVSLEAEVADAVVRKIDGYAEYAEPGSTEFQPLQVSKKIKVGTTIKTAEKSEVVLRVVPGAAMKIAEKTTVTLDNMAFEGSGANVTSRTANINLSEGTVSALLDKTDPKGTDFKIKTPQGSAAARGTFYGVSVKDGQSYVRVQEGSVGIVETKKDEKAKE